MAKKNVKPNAGKISGNDKELLMEKLKNYIRTNGVEFLKDKNINSIGIGFKQKNGKLTEELCIQFTVNTKAKIEQLESINTNAIPEAINIEGVSVPTDVIQRKFKLSKLVAEAASPTRKTKVNPVIPGVSVGHVSISAGTIGCIVYDKNNGAPYILSNWHVLQSTEGNIGEDIVQPGPHDDNRIQQNRLGRLVRSHLGHAGDCAIASIEERTFKPEILDLNIKPEKLGEPELGDVLVKSGRTTKVTYGRVTRIDVISKIDYEGNVGEKEIGSFEISVEPRRRPRNGEISQGGDSGAVWLFVNDALKPTNVLAGLHFGGEADGNPDEFALACYPKSVFEKLEISLKEPQIIVPTDNIHGYNSNFLIKTIKFPKLKTQHSSDAVMLDNSPFLHYTHFSLIQSKQRRLAHLVGWNIDGDKLKSLSRKGISFKFDTRIPDKYQVGESVYSGNRLDRGHIARRADLVWGGAAEAKKANTDSFFFTNIAPQMDNFNQSGAGGIWGRLEDAVFEEVNVQDLKISVFGGPVFNDNDKEYRGIKIPREFFKIIIYAENDKLKAKSFLLTQNINQLEVLDLDDFKVYQVAVSELTDRTKLIFPDELEEIDTVTQPEALENAEDVRMPLNSLEDINW